MPPTISFNTIFSFFGGLHIEQALLKIHGQLVTGTGIDDIIALANLPTVGLKNAMCNVSDIKKSPVYCTDYGMLFDKMSEPIF